MLSWNGYILRNIQAIAFMLLLMGPGKALAQNGILDSIFTFRAGSLKTGAALNLITRETGYNFTYDSRLVDPEGRTRMTFTDQTLRTVLDSILNNDSLVYSIIDRYIIISKIRTHSEGIKDQITNTPVSGSVSGIILEEETREPVPFATIGLKRSGRGSIANINGEFILNIPYSLIYDTLVVSHLGFIRREIPVRQFVGNNFNIILTREYISIPEIVIRNKIPQEIIFKTLQSVPANYGNSPALLTGFYREGIRKKNEIQTYAEAILQIFKSSYTTSFYNDQIKIIKSRKIENTDVTDTLTVRLKAGLSTSLDLDIVRNGFEFISRGNINDYTYRITDIVTVDEDAAYVIEFEQKRHIDLPLFRGSVIINTSDFAVLNAVFEINPAHIDKIRDSFISSPSREFNTWPTSVRYSVTYRKVDGRYFLSHVRGDLEFTSKQKRRLFNTQFMVFFELAVTDVNTGSISRFEREELAPVHSVFSSTITSYDPVFWQGFDFLKPEDDLLEALKDMKVRLSEFSGLPD